MTWSVDHAADPVRSSSWWNLPNALTVLRLLLVPVFAVLLLRGDGADTDRVLAAVVFVVASATDFADGAIARRRGIVTTFGKVVDPIADKALTGTALVLLSVLGDLPWWVTVVILVREIGVTLLRFWVIRRGVIPASRGGKAKTVAQMLAILLYLLPVTGWLETARTAVLAVALLLTVLTGADYVVRAVRLRRAVAS
ncbi:MAG TPA: CDP-diacylglycerol--glycerol-3-phosphate 3-phosphatidyltransferase [Candidatus Nanopelagicales bacterium]|jgi:CDP-diacylglycerol--glycerol-3-phosphate 3-phosphatidyltransferase|nr:CDP-diacylglycerol--glycerol-3-phosphate 3-phosphatidyltransferase [Candidatus Nanopelagicales bacterium]